VAESVGQGSLIPSLQSEQARLLAGIAGDLERTLTSIDGVVSARVHLAVPAADPLVEIAEHSVPSASVLIRHHGVDFPVPTVAIQRLVAGAVADMTENRVAVVMTRVVESSMPERKIVPFGPFAVTRESARSLRWVAGGFVGLNLTMLILLLVFWRKARQAATSRLPGPVQSRGEPQ
jgi:type III secretion protein J